MTIRVALLTLTVFATSLWTHPPLLAQDARTRANSYDDAWQDEWTQRARNTLGDGLYQLPESADLRFKTDGFVVHIGDSLTHDSGRFAINYGGSNSGDIATLEWTQSALEERYATVPGFDWWQMPILPDTKNGWWLALQGYTGRDGWQAATWLDGPTSPLQDLLANDTIPSEALPNSGAADRLAIVHDAMVATILLGTNEATALHPVDAFEQDLQSIIAHLEAAGIVPILTTIPPVWPDWASDDSVWRRGTEIAQRVRSMAAQLHLPLIDFEREILERIPVAPWLSEAYQADGVHLKRSAFDEYPDPDANQGEVLRTRGGDLLDFLRIQKILEVREAAPLRTLFASNFESGTLGLWQIGAPIRSGEE